MSTVAIHCCMYCKLLPVKLRLHGQMLYRCSFYYVHLLHIIHIRSWFPLGLLAGIFPLMKNQ